MIDTAPTGHTLPLLDAAESYHREVSRSLNEIPEAVRQLLPRLRDPDFTRVYLVTLAEATPVHEALALQSDLHRAGIEPAGWIINQSLAPLTVSDPVLAQRRLREFAISKRSFARVTAPSWYPGRPIRLQHYLYLDKAVYSHKTRRLKTRRQTMKIEIYDPAMCCSTGVCGPSVDPELVRIQEALRQIQKQAPAVQVERIGLASDPRAFVSNTVVAELLKSEGPECLPLVFADGELISKGNYPGNEQLRTILKQSGIELTFGEKKKSSCGCGPGCC